MLQEREGIEMGQAARGPLDRPIQPLDTNAEAVCLRNAPQIVFALLDEERQAVGNLAHGIAEDLGSRRSKLAIDLGRNVPVWKRRCRMTSPER
jgi:hypothetical protein